MNKGLAFYNKANNLQTKHYFPLKRIVWKMDLKGVVLVTGGSGLVGKAIGFGSKNFMGWVFHWIDIK